MYSFLINLECKQHTQCRTGDAVEAHYYVTTLAKVGQSIPWDVLGQLGMSHRVLCPIYPSIPGVHPIPVYHGMRWDTGLCGTCHALLFHPIVHTLGRDGLLVLSYRHGPFWDIPSVSLTLVCKGRLKIPWTFNGNAGQPS